VEIPPQQAGIKWLSYRDAKDRVEAYDAARARHSESENGLESET